MSTAELAPGRPGPAGPGPDWTGPGWTGPAWTGPAWTGPARAPGAYQVVLVQPEGYIHTAALSEVMESVVCGLRSLGATVSSEVNKLALPGPPAILFGAQFLEPQEVDLLAPGTVVYNLEQVHESSPWCSPTYVRAMQTCQVWDYSLRNIAALARLGITSTAIHVPVGYVPELTRVPHAEEDIDVLFYGSMNERRAQVINQLRALGLRAEAVFGVYGAARDQLIARSKVVLNLHFYETSIFELVRVSYLLANRKAVVAECHPGTEIDPDMTDAVELATYDRLAASCARLVGDPRERAALAERGFARMQARDERTYLARALGLSPA